MIDLLEALGVRRTDHGRAVYDERMLCHSPQERLHIAGGWRDGVLPPIEALPAAEQAATLAHYRAFGRAVEEAGRGGAFAVPTARAPWSEALAALDGQTFAAWLDARGLVAPALRWYLDYCCRDDYGAGSAQVSAWAGVHYFASRHGFHAPGDEPLSGVGVGGDGDAVLTWPQGNGWLAERLASAIAASLHTGRVVRAVREDRHDATVDALNVATGEHERWTAPQVVLATPLFVAARLLAAPPAALIEAVAGVAQAPWLVANLALAAALDDRPGAPPSWDNVVYGSASLGYVDAMHQSLRPFAGPTVLTSYWALGGDSAAELAGRRRSLLADDWAARAAAVVAELAEVHPDLPAKVQRVDLMRYGHAMSVPAPGVRGSAALQALAAPQRRIHFAHSDLSGYSVFEEALYHGTRAGREAAARAGA